MTYMYGEFDEKIYMKQPLDFEECRENQVDCL